MQQHLFNGIKQSKRRVHNNTPVYLKSDKIKQNIAEWNVIKHVYRYQTLYKICELLYLMTYNKQLNDVSYYDENEIDDKNTYKVIYAEINNTSNLPIEERVKKHINIIRRIRNQDKTLKYTQNKHIKHDENGGQLSLFN